MTKNIFQICEIWHFHRYSVYSFFNWQMFDIGSILFDTGDFHFYFFFKFLFKRKFLPFKDWIVVQKRIFLKCSVMKTYSVYSFFNWQMFDIGSILFDTGRILSIWQYFAACSIWAKKNLSFGQEHWFLLGRFKILQLSSN
jgi:hypothetical protein